MLKFRALLKEKNWIFKWKFLQYFTPDKNIEVV